MVRLSSVVEVALSWVGTALTITQDLLLTLLYLIFLLSGGPGFAAKMARAFPEHVASKLAGATPKIESQIQSYLRTKTLLSLLQGAVATGVLLAFGVNFAVLFGILTFFFNYIPNIGALIAVEAPGVSRISAGTLWHMLRGNPEFVLPQLNLEKASVWVRTTLTEVFHEQDPDLDASSLHPSGEGRHPQTAFAGGHRRFSQGELTPNSRGTPDGFAFPPARELLGWADQTSPP